MSLTAFSCCQAKEYKRFFSLDDQYLRYSHEEKGVMKRLECDFGESVVNMIYQLLFRFTVRRGVSLRNRNIKESFLILSLQIRS